MVRWSLSAGHCAS